MKNKIIEPFKIDNSHGRYALFPFLFDGKVLNTVSCAISKREAGNMNFDPAQTNPNRAALFSELGMREKMLCVCSQTHGRNVCVADKSGVVYQADGLIGCGGCFLSVLVADCLPVYLFDTESRAFAILHSGWKGTGIVENALKLMAENYNTKPENVAALLGPCITASSYNVDRERALQFEKEFGGTGDFPLGPVTRYSKTDDGEKWFIDLQAANARLLAKNGVRNIAYSTDCTFADERLGSYRREGPDHYTRMIAICGGFKKEIW
jgi:YfiH family protein